MSLRRFFDWSTPFLPSVAREIVESALKKGRSLDLGKYVFILSSGRAVRALEARVQIEAQRAVDEGRAEPDWTPPSFRTIGAALDDLYVSVKRVASPLAKLARHRVALRAFFDADPRAKILLPALDALDDAAATKLSETFLKLDQQLADERRAYLEIAAACETLGQHEEAERWRALDALAKAYRRELDAVDLVDLNDARERAIRSGRVGGVPNDLYNGDPREYRVVGAVDLKPQQIALLEAVGERVEYWVFAPEEEKDKFDEYGCAAPDAWKDFQFPIEIDRFFQVDSPVEEGEAIALLLRELSKEYDREGKWFYRPIDPRQVAVGVPDDEVAPFAEEQIAALGYSSIRAEGEPANASRVYRVLQCLADYLETRSFDALGELLRRPDVENYVARKRRFFALDDARDDDERHSPENLVDALERDMQRLRDSELEEIDAQSSETSDGDRNADARFEYKSAPVKEFDDYAARFMPTKVADRWFVRIDDDNSKRDAFYYELRRATAILDALLREFRNDERGAFSKIAASQTGARDDGDDKDALDALKFDVADFDAAQRLAKSGAVAFNRDDFALKFSYAANQRKRPLREWAKPISAILTAFYGELENEDDRAAKRLTRRARAQIIEFIKAFNAVLDEFVSFPSDDPTTGADAIRLALKQLERLRIPPLPDSEAIELQGWLDLALDDAPYLILSGFNEGVVPSTRASDLFLPNETRRALAMTDSGRAFARDAYLATTLARSKRAFFCVFARRSLDGNPLLPSRFAFAAPSDEVPRRVARFFSAREKDDLDLLRRRQRGRDFRAKENANVDAQVASLQDLAAKAEQARERQDARDARRMLFQPPVLSLAGLSLPVVMRVTEFEAFLKCPYRYFLRYVFNLQSVPTTSTGELDAAGFGALAHDVLRDFGLDEIRDSTDERAIYRWLSTRLDERASGAFNEFSSPFVFVQIEQIRARLRSFASWQASWRASGNVVQFVETSPRDGGVKLEVGGDAPLYVKGRIDRIDYNAAENAWRVFDYKTYDAPKGGSSKRDFKKPIVRNGRELMTARVGNVVDLKHREKMKRRKPIAVAFCRKLGLNVDESADAPFDYRWINLQLPLYRLLAQKLLEETGKKVEDSQISLGYIGISNGDVAAYAAPWSERDLEYADATARWVVRKIRELWALGKVDPQRPVEPLADFGTLLADIPPQYDDFAPIALSALD